MYSIIQMPVKHFSLHLDYSTFAVMVAKAGGANCARRLCPRPIFGDLESSRGPMGQILVHAEMPMVSFIDSC